MFPNMNIIRITYYRVTIFIHIYPKIFVLRLFHENITVITIDGCTCSIASIHIIPVYLIHVIYFVLCSAVEPMTTLSWQLCKQACYQVGYGRFKGMEWKERETHSYLEEE